MGIMESLLKSALLGFDSMVSKAVDALTGGLVDSVWDDIILLSEGLKPFCSIIIGFCLMIELAQTAAKVDLLKWEHGLKIGVKAVLARVCLDVAPTFLKACYAQAAKWIADISAGNSGVGTMVWNQVSGVIDQLDLGFLDKVGMIASLLLVIVAIKLCGLMVQVIAFGRMCELLVYLAVSPVPCAFLPLGEGGGDFSRITMKFVKSFVAICLQGVMMILCIYVFNLLIGNAITGMVQEALQNSDKSVAVSDLCYTMLLGAIVLVMSVGKCGSWAKSILDAM